MQEEFKEPVKERIVKDAKNIGGGYSLPPLAGKR